MPILNKLLFTQSKKPDKQVVFQPIKILHLTRHVPPVTPRVSRAFLCSDMYRNSWIINNLLDIYACSTAVYFLNMTIDYFEHKRGKAPRGHP